MNILLIEDEPLARWIEKKALEEAGFFVTEAVSCDDAKRLLQSDSYDLLVCDYRLPDGTGLDVLGWLRAKNRHDPAVVLSAEADCLDAVTLAELAVQEVFLKPVDVESFQNRLKELAGSVDDNPSTDLPQEQWIDRYLLISDFNDPTEHNVVRVEEALKENAWIVLDISALETMDAAMIQKISRWAERCRLANGRLCLMGASEAVWKPLSEAEMDRQCDLAADRMAVQAMGRRITANCERNALLDAIIRREPLDHQAVETDDGT